MVQYMYRRVEAGLGEYDFQYKFITSMIFQYYYCTPTGGLLSPVLFCKYQTFRIFLCMDHFFRANIQNMGNFLGF